MLVSYGPGGPLSELRVLPNRGDAELFSNIESACKRALPEVDAVQALETPAVIVGGGPSLASTLETIRHMKELGAVVFALNNSARYLVEHGIRPDYQVIIDPRQQNVGFVSERWSAECLLSSQCHPDLFDKCAEVGYPVRIWHPIIDGIEKHIGRDKPLLIGGGLTVGLSGMCLVYTLGYRQMHLFGYDSCHSEQKSHAYEQPMNASDEMVTVAVDGRVFNCSVAMAAQATAFQGIAEMLADNDSVIFAHGDGLIPYIAKKMVEEKKPLKAVYDLALAPPTYDFLSFLVEAERARVEGGFTHLEVIFQPGPVGGFRHDNLPPSVEEREGMLHRICVSACRMLPSVREVRVLKERQKIEGEVFPPDYKVEHPTARYGTRHLKNIRPLRSSAGAKSWVAKRYPKPYATITLRQSSYWPTRNSNLRAWASVAAMLHERGILAVFVPDYEGDPVRGYCNCHEAAIDLDVRMALYEGAVMNFSVSNGPMALCYLSQAPYMVFKMVDENTHSTSKAFLESHGLNEGESFGENGTLVWKDDTEEVLLSEIGNWLDMNHFMEKKRACL